MDGECGSKEQSVEGAVYIMPVSPFARATQFFATVTNTYGTDFVRFLLVVYCGVKGVAFNVLVSTALPVFQQFGVSGSTFQLAQVVAMTPWSMKSWIGVMSDCFPLGRYHKKGYLMLSSSFGLAGLMGLIVLTRPNSSLTPSMACWLAAVLYMMTNLQVATFDLLAEGKYAELMRMGNGGSEVLSLVWGCFNAGALLGAVLIFFTVDNLGVQPLLWLSLIPFLTAAMMVWRNFVPEQPARSRAMLRLKIKSQPRLFSLALAMAVGSASIAVSTIASAHVRLVVTLAVVIVLNVASFRALPRTLALSNCYMFLVSASYMDISGPLGYYYTAGPNCVPGGPHFSYGYYLAVSNFVGALAGGLGSVMFQAMSSWTFRQAFCMTTVAQIAASVFDIIIVNRWNIRVGISDQGMYLFGDAAIGQLTSMLIILPQALLTSRLCPKGVEATVYALLAGFQNFGGNVSTVLGAWLTDALGIDSAGAARGARSADVACDFSALPLALVICHVGLPLLVVPLTFLMVPDARMDDERAFDVVSPVPTFRSPPGSPSPPPSPHAWPDDIANECDEGYVELPDELSKSSTKAMERQISDALRGSAPSESEALKE